MKYLILTFLVLLSSMSVVVAKPPTSEQVADRTARESVRKVVEQITLDMTEKTGKPVGTNVVNKIEEIVLADERNIAVVKVLVTLEKNKELQEELAITFVFSHYLGKNWSIENVFPRPSPRYIELLKKKAQEEQQNGEKL